MNWQAISHSVMGTSHQKSGLPCQDYGDSITLDDILIGAVSDGAGSAKYSDVGSELAVKTALNHLQYRLKNLKKKYPDLATKTPSEATASGIFEQMLEKVITRLRQETEQGYFFKDLSCTLLAFIATPHWMAAMQVGDGFIVMRSLDSLYELLFPPTKGEYANQTVFVTSPTAFDELQIRVIPKSPNFIFASTDGLERLAITLATNTPLPKFFEGFENLKTPTSTQNNLEEAISNFLNSPDVNSRTDDDKTVLISWYSDLVTSNVNGGKDTEDIRDAEDTEDKGESEEDNKDINSIKPKQPVKSSSKINREIRVKRTIAILIQNIIFAVLSGLLFHHSYHLIDLLSNLTSVQSINSAKFINHSRFLWFLTIILVVIFNSLSYLLLKKSYTTRIQVVLIILGTTIIGLGIGWLVYYPLRPIFLPL